MSQVLQPYEQSTSKKSATLDTCKINKTNIHCNRLVNFVEIVMLFNSVAILLLANCTGTIHCFPGTEDNSLLTQESLILLSRVKDASHEAHLYISFFCYTVNAPQVKHICLTWGLLNFLESNGSCPWCRQYSVVRVCTIIKGVNRLRSDCIGPMQAIRIDFDERVETKVLHICTLLYRTHF